MALISVRMVLRTSIPAKMEDSLKSSFMVATMPKRLKAEETMERMTMTTITVVCRREIGVKEASRFYAYLLGTRNEPLHHPPDVGESSRNRRDTSS